MANNSYLTRLLNRGLERSFGAKEQRDIQKRKWDLLLSGELDEGPQLPVLEQLERGLGEAAGFEEGLPTTRREAQMRGLQGTLGIGSAVIDPVDAATAQAAEQRARERGHGETAQQLIGMGAGALTGLGGGDIGRAGLFLSKTDPVTKVMDKEIRDAAAKAARTNPLWSKGTPGGRVTRRRTYKKDPDVGIELKEVLGGQTHGDIALRDVPSGPVLDKPTLRMPTGNYRLEDLPLLVKHEEGHKTIIDLQDQVAGFLRRKNIGGPPLTPDEQEAFNFLSDLRKAANMGPWRPKGHRVREALDAAGVPHDPIPHGATERLADLWATIGTPGSEKYIPKEARDIMKKWTSRDPWTAAQPGKWEDVLNPMAEARLKALREP